MTDHKAGTDRGCDVICRHTAKRPAGRSKVNWSLNILTGGGFVGEETCRQTLLQTSDGHYIGNAIQETWHFDLFICRGLRTNGSVDPPSKYYQHPPRAHVIFALCRRLLTFLYSRSFPLSTYVCVLFNILSFSRRDSLRITLIEYGSSLVGISLFR